MREELLSIVEKNSRIDLKELAVLLGAEEIDVVLSAGIIRLLTGRKLLLRWLLH